MNILFSKVKCYKSSVKQTPFTEMSIFPLLIMTTCSALIWTGVKKCIKTSINIDSTKRFVAESVVKIIFIQFTSGIKAFH